MSVTEPRNILSPLLVMVFACLAADARSGGVPCASLSSGNWSEPSLWDCGGAPGPPGATDFVTISTGDTVVLDVDGQAANIVVDPGGDLDVGASVDGLSLAWYQAGSDLSNAAIDLAGDLILEANSGADMVVGQVDGGFDLILNSGGETHINAELGGSVPLASLTTDGAGTTRVYGDISTSGSQQFNDLVQLEGDIVFSGDTGQFPQGLDAFGYDATFVYAGAFELPALLVNVNNLITSGAGTTMIGVNVNTLGSQSYGSPVLLTQDVVLASMGGGDIQFDLLAGPYNLTVNTEGVTRFAADVGNPPLSSIETDSGGSTNFTQTITIGLDGIQVTSFNDPVTIGASGDVTIDQAGAGSIVFHDSINAISGSPHRLIVNDVSGSTDFLGPVNIGQLTTNDGPGEDMTRVAGGSITTNQGGADNGFMTFNDPVRVEFDTTFTETGSGSIAFHGGVDSGVIRRGFVPDVTINSDSQTVLAGAGFNTGIGRLIIDPGGSTLLTGNVDTSGGQVYGDAVYIGSFVDLHNNTSGAVQFDVSLDGDDDSGTPSSVVISNSAGECSLATTGMIDPLDELDVGCVTRLHGDVHTLGNQFYNEVNVESGVMIVGDEIRFNGSIGRGPVGTAGLTVDALGVVAVDSHVGSAMAPLAHFRIQDAESIELNAGMIITGNDQVYNGLVELSDPVSMMGATVMISGNVGLLDGNDLFLDLSAGESEIHGGVYGSGGLVKDGAGMLTLVEGIHTFTGGINHQGGVLLVNGTTDSASAVDVNSANLGGHGVINGVVLLDAGTIAPGTSPGILTTGDLSLDSLSVLEAEIDGIFAGNEYDQVVVAGTVTLAGPALEVTGSYVPSGQGDALILINNDSGEAVEGTFADLPEGAYVNNNGPMQITYTGGDGNDVVLLDIEAVFANDFE